MVDSIIRVGFLGLGTVGTGAIRIIGKRQAEFRDQGIDLHIEKALVRDLSKPRMIATDRMTLTNNPDDILLDPKIHVVVEVMGSVDLAKAYIEKALQQRKFVVTANKDLMAQHGSTLLRIARNHGVNIYYEASVGGGIPLVRPLKTCLVANKIKNMMGIINGTTNYILTQMSQGEKEFGEALAEAQAKGFAEQDPSSDLEGYDAAYKLAILSSLAFHTSLAVEQVYTESIRHVSLRDITYAKELGFAIKLLAIAEESAQGLSLRVHPTFIPNDHPLAAVNNEFNALFVEGDAVGEVMFYGRGAGSLPTGSAVVADLLEVARTLRHQITPDVCEADFTPCPVISMEERISRFYVRLKAYDQPGVFGNLAMTFGDQQISLDMIIQKRSEEGIAEVVLVTHDVKESQFFRAIERVKALRSIRNISNVIRVLEKGAM